MNRRRIVVIGAFAALVAPPFLLDALLPEARPPADAGPGLTTAARAVCGSPPWGRVGRLEWDDEGPGIKVVCTWHYWRVNWRTNVSCAEGSWNGPIGWTNWGAIAPCVSRPSPPSEAR